MYQNRNNEYEILSLFSGNLLQRHFLREISRKTKIPLKTAQTALKNLESQSILKSKTEGRNKYFFLNLENILTKNYLLFAEIYKTNAFIQKNPQITMFAKELSGNPLIIVFGSFAKGENRKSSDFDIVKVINSKYEIPKHLLPMKIHEIEMTEEAFKKALETQETLIMEIVDNHIILCNHSSYVSIIWDYYGKKP